MAHFKAAIAFAVLFVLTVVGLIYLIATYAAPAIDGIFARRQDAAVEIIVLVGAPLFVALWILRAISKLFHINIAGMVDAGERVVMVRTFLSLTEQGKVGEADNILILQALFRPSPASASQDETPPPHWFDLVMERIRKSGS